MRAREIKSREGNREKKMGEKSESNEEKLKLWIYGEDDPLELHFVLSRVTNTSV